MNYILMVRQEVEYKDVAQLLHSNFISSACVTIFAAFYLVINFQTPETVDFKWSWLSALIFLMLLRWVDHIVWNRSISHGETHLKNAILRYISGTLITGVLLSTYAVYTFGYSDNIESSVIILTLSALAGGAASVLSANKLSAILYPTILLVPASITLYLSPSNYQNIFGLLGAAYSFTIIIIAIKSSNFTLQAIHLKNENTELINQMETKVAQRTEKIYQLSNIDPLTNLFNRAAFIHKLSEQLTLCDHSNTHLALLFIDLDGFKKVNDSLGHTIGDKLLQLTAKRIQGKEDANKLVCQWGGDEFLIAYSNTDQSLANDYAIKLIKEISIPYDIDNTNLSIGATIGISLYPEHAKFADALIQYADTAMYVQKRELPKSVRLFDQRMHDNIKREQWLKTSLSEAINKEQLNVVYQPIINARTGKTSSFEALLRWNLNGEEISPMEFIDIAEQYGLINDIGNWVLHQSCMTAAKWCNGDQRQSPKVSVNVSVLQLEEDNFIEIIENVLNTSKLNGNKLIIEITESTFSNDENLILQRVKQVQSLGVEVSIDDFGTGYSSLSVVQNLSANTIKVDREFVKSIDSSGEAIIEAAKNIAEKLGYTVVVEGIETEQQAQIVKRLGIDMLQGYYFSKPMESEVVDAYLKKS